jgi:hypothetical protein
MLALNTVIGCGGALSGNLTSGEVTNGDETSEATVSSMEDADGNALIDGATGVNPTSITAKFSSDVSDEICSNSDISLSCSYAGGSALTPTLVITMSESDSTACVATVQDPWKYGLMDCVLSYSASVATSEALLPSESTSSLSFTTGCSVGDDFNSVTSDCWSVVPDSGIYEGDIADPAWTTWDDLLANSILTFSPTTSTLNYASMAEAKSGIYKNGTLSADFEFVLNLKNISISGIHEDLLIGSLSNLSVEEVECAFWFGTAIFDGEFKCLALYGTSEGIVAARFAGCSSFSDVSVRVQASDETWSFQYKGDDNDWADIDEGEMGEFPPPSAVIGALPSTPSLIIHVSSKETAGLTAEIDSIQATGFTVVDQY